MLLRYFPWINPRSRKYGESRSIPAAVSRL